ncbi:ABC transporter substrate-binding protein [Kiloniella sp. EL199]|uniref:substrate-binding periplasmic protein n=1 Tax=Kiloniella sp. EL199 TaxID=2107581 RepID=UPI000EA1145D|nr:transporter substrate-binding domain-containing protein [Kiloniella sp. EL199]
MRLLRSFCILFLLFSTSLSKASDLQFLTENYPPFNYLENDELKGIGADIVKALGNKLGIEKTPRVLPWKRAYKTALTKPNTGIFSISRTKDREDLFQWVGPLFSVRDYIFVKRNFDFTGQNISDLKKIPSIGTQAEGAVHKALEKMDFNNLTLIYQVSRQLDLLLTNRVSALQVSDLAMSFDLQKNSLSFSQVKPIAILSQADLYLAFSKNTPAAEVDRWQKALNELIKEGKHAAILSKHFPSLSIWGQETGIEVQVN